MKSVTLTVQSFTRPRVSLAKISEFAVLPARRGRGALSPARVPSRVLPMAAAAVAPSRPSSLPRAPSPPRRSTAFFLRCAAPGARPQHNHVPHKPSAAALPVQKSCAVGRCRSRQRQGRSQCSQTEVAASGTVDDDEACELVRGADLVIGEGDDSFRAYLFEAVKNNNGTGVLLLSDIFGFDDSATRDFAYRVACNGYNVLVPDLFRGNPWRKSLPMDGFEQWMAGQAPARVSSDVEACTRWLVDEFTAAGVSKKKLGVVGFCYGGGRLVETLARDAEKVFSAGVCFYGSRMDASLGDRIAAPVLFVCGDGDALCPVENVRELERRAKGAKAAVYAGRGHAFAHRPQSLEEDADAEHAFNAMRAWLHDHLLA